eukprot:TRINITY_DN5654_c0_g1_i4.p1 TRINITY_DN5654_c0_g1~~TRINITY_DN5654_c0_g1_i4.p1  ORF type:complete len:375 (-),score=68.17 TRINITY_DN5654_c0_g1_i4:16-1140(-)
MCIRDRVKYFYRYIRALSIEAGKEAGQGDQIEIYRQDESQQLTLFGLINRDTLKVDDFSVEDVSVNEGQIYVLQKASPNQLVRISFSETQNYEVSFYQFEETLQRIEIINDVVDGKSTTTAALISAKKVWEAELVGVEIVIRREQEISPVSDFLVKDIFISPKYLIIQADIAIWVYKREVSKFQRLFYEFDLVDTWKKNVGLSFNIFQDQLLIATNLGIFKYELRTSQLEACSQGELGQQSFTLETSSKAFGKSDFKSQLFQIQIIDEEDRALYPRTNDHHKIYLPLSSTYEGNIEDYISGPLKTPSSFVAESSAFDVEFEAIKEYQATFKFEDIPLESIIFSRLVPFPEHYTCLLYTSPSPRDRQKSRMPSSA